MVARSGPGWRLAPSLCVLMDEIDALWPFRDHASDGSIGDQDHANRTSDHNPYDGWVHAVDIDEDLDGNTADSHDLAPIAAHLIARRDPRVRYLIYEGGICKFYGDRAYQWQSYDGENAHKQHLHVSIIRSETARSNGRTWLEDLMTVTPKDIEAIADAVERRLLDDFADQVVGDTKRRNTMAALFRRCLGIETMAVSAEQHKADAETGKRFQELLNK